MFQGWRSHHVVTSKTLSFATVMGPFELEFCHGHGTTWLPVTGPPRHVVRGGPRLPGFGFCSRSIDLDVRVGMVFREVSVIEIRGVLRAWMSGMGLRRVAGQAGVDRKTARSYVNAALAAGLVRDGGEEQLIDELVVAGRPARPQGHGAAWEVLEGEHAQIVGWVGQGLPHQVSDHWPPSASCFNAKSKAMLGSGARSAIAYSVGRWLSDRLSTASP